MPVPEPAGAPIGIGIAQLKRGLGLLNGRIYSEADGSPGGAAAIVKQPCRDIGDLGETVSAVDGAALGAPLLGVLPGGGAVGAVGFEPVIPPKFNSPF
jgi:hypothetical protein